MPIKKVVVSAAGQGTRMQELSRDKSKHLITVNNRPFLVYLLDNIFEAGYMDIMLVVGFRQDLITEFLQTYPAPVGATISTVNQFEILGPKEKEYGTACPLKCVKDFVGRDQFISLVGDNFYSVDDLASMNIDDSFCYVGGLKAEHPERFGVLIEDGELLQEIIEKPKEFVGDLINTSLYKFTPDVFEKLPLIKKSPRGEYEITDVLTLLAKDKKVKIKKLQDNWMDFGKQEDIKKFQEEFLKDGTTK